MQILAGERGLRGVARERDFELAETAHAPGVHQGMEKRRVVAERVEQVDAAFRPVRVQARRHAQEARVSVGDDGYRFRISTGASASAGSKPNTRA